MQSLVIASLAALGLVAGASVVMQQVLIASLRNALDSISWALLISYVGGTLAMCAILLVARERWPGMSAAASAPWITWASGLFGVLYMMLAVYLIPKLGAATMLALLIAGQMLTSLLFDHFGLFGLPQQSADLTRIAGAGLLIGGVVLIRA